MSNPFVQHVQQPPRRLTYEAISAIYSGIVDLVARLGRIGEGRDAKIAAINPDLTEGAKAREAQAINGAFGSAAESILEKLAVERDVLVGQGVHFTSEAVRARAAFGETSDEQRNAAIGSLWMARLAKASERDLREIAIDAASRFDRALCREVENEIAHRGLSGDPADEIAALCASVPLPPQDVIAAQTIADGYAIAEMARLAAEERINGKSRVLDRMTAAFAASALAGKVNPPAVPGAIAPALSAPASV